MDTRDTHFSTASSYNRVDYSAATTRVVLNPLLSLEWGNSWPPDLVLLLPLLSQPTSLSHSRAEQAPTHSLEAVKSPSGQ